MPEGCVIKLTRILWYIFGPEGHFKRFKKESFMKNLAKEGITHLRIIVSNIGTY